MASCQQASPSPHTGPNLMHSNGSGQSKISDPGDTSATHVHAISTPSAPPVGNHAPDKGMGQVSVGAVHIKPVLIAKIGI